VEKLGPEKHWSTQLLGFTVIGGFVGAGAVHKAVRDCSLVVGIDASIAAWCKQHVSGAAISIMRFVTQLGSTVGILGVAAAVIITEQRRGWGRGVRRYVLVTVGGEILLTNVAKSVFDRDRPQLLQLVRIASSSFPSGHTLGAAATWSTYAYLLGRGRSVSVKVGLFAGAGTIAGAVAASRVALGVHWVTDVLAGLSLGWGWAAGTALLFRGHLHQKT
jgi:membrane-associated phospholipid phosphatase